MTCTLQELCQKILKGVFSVPAYMSAEARDLLARMLTVVPEQRITFQQVLPSASLLAHAQQFTALQRCLRMLTAAMLHLCWPRPAGAELHDCLRRPSTAAALHLSRCALSRCCAASLLAPLNRCSPEPLPSRSAALHHCLYSSPGAALPLTPHSQHVLPCISAGAPQLLLHSPCLHLLSMC